jgi:peroxiredoxin
MNKIALALLAAVLAAPMAPAYAAEVGKPAPAFTATTSTGESITLDSLKGKVVVLEWTNNDCPFVKKHYDGGDMQKLQKDMTGKGVVWAQVISSAPGKQGNVTGEQAIKLNADRGAAPTHTFLDPEGTLGRAYGAKSTPHMFVINAEGILSYAGAIDDNPSADEADVAGAKNYVRAAVEELLAGKPVTVAATKQYGCSIKYAK